MKRRTNEDVLSSDSDSEYEEENQQCDDVNIEQYETEHQTKVRLKKKIIQKLKDDIKKRKVDDVETEVRKTLEEEALEKQGKLMKNKAAQCMVPSEALTILKKYKHDITCFVYSLDGKFVFAGSRNGDIVKWNVETSEVIGLVKGGKRNDKYKLHCTRVTAMAICDEYLATGDQHNKIFIWNISNMTVKKVLIKHRRPITSLVYRRNTQQLFSADRKGIIFVWDMILMDTIEELLGHTGEITGLDSNLANNCVSCSGIGDLSVKLWKVDKGSVLSYNIPKKQIEIALECISMINERYFVAGSVSNCIYLWDSVSKKSPISVVSRAHDTPEQAELVMGSTRDIFVSSICALKQSTIFASASNMSQVKIWNLVPGDGDQMNIVLLFVLPNIIGCVNELRFSPCGKNLAIGVCDQHKATRMTKRVPHAKSAVNIYKLFK